MKKMNFKAIFIIPSQKKIYGMKIFPAYHHLGILYIGSVLEKIGVDVKVLDMDADRLDRKKLLSIIKEFEPNIAGFTATTPVINEAFNLAGIIKGHFSIPIMLGGIHVSMNSEECIKHPAVDFIVKGEGEDTIKELVLELSSGSPDFTKIKGLLYKDGSNFHFTGERKLIENLDTIPFPARHLLSNFSVYRPPDAEKLPVATIMTTRGCPGQCTFCCTKYNFSGYRMRSVGNVLEEMDRIISKFKVKEIHIADDAFNANKARTLELCEAIKKRNYKINFEFLNGLRADIIDADILDAFKSIGVKNVGFGVESADKDILKNVKKNIMPEKVEESFRLAKSKGFKTWAFFILGLPGETETTIKKSIEFAKKLDPDFAKFFISKPFPGSDIFYEMKQKGFIDDFKFDNYGIYTPPVHRLETLTKSDLLYWQKKAYREFYFRPKKILEHIKRQRSIPQLKLSLRGLSFVCFNAFKN